MLKKHKTMLQIRENGRKKVVQYEGKVRQITYSLTDFTLRAIKTIEEISAMI